MWTWDYVYRPISTFVLLTLCIYVLCPGSIYYASIFLHFYLLPKTQFLKIC